jgi:hypothetical protein
MNRICFPHVLHSGATFIPSTPCIEDKPNEARTSDRASMSMQSVDCVQDCNNSVHNEPNRASQITCTFCPTLNLGIVTVVQTMGTVMRNALLLVTAPSRLTTCAFSIELEHLLGWSVVFEQLGPHPFAKVLNFLCFLIRRRA